jgi:predicted RNA-binding protein with PUA-like domain
MVDVKPVKPMPKPVTLEQIKADPRLQELALIRQSRLSVVPIDAKSWKVICGLGGLKGE